MPINKALIKYGYVNFSLLILEYCEKKECIKREGLVFYIKLLKPEYNIIQDPIAPIFAGRRHSSETLEKLSSWYRSKEYRKKMSEAKKGQKQKPEGSGRPSQQISVFDNKKKMRLLFMILFVKQLGL